MDIRRNHRDMTRAQKETFINAILRLKNEVNSVLRPGQQSRYDDYVQIHRNSMGGPTPLIPNPHQSPLFYPWHRILLRQFELDLQRAGNDRTITLPYWNWQLTGADNPFTSAFMGGNGDSLQNQRITTGPFCWFNGQFNVTVWDEDGGDAGVRRNLGATGALPSPETVISALNRFPYWSEPEGWENFSEAVLHNPVHLWIGGNMAQSSSPNDPIFFLHHCYLDLLWERWRQQHLNSPSFAPRDTDPNGVLGSRLIFNPDHQPAPWPQPYTVEQTLVIGDLEYGYDDI